MNIFRDSQDYSNFLKRVRLVLNLSRMPLVREKIRITPLPKDAIHILGYVLMPNHFHFIIKQNQEITPSKFIHKLCTSYAMYFSNKYSHVGHLFQDQFKAINVSTDQQLLWLLRYIHMNPIKSGIAKNISSYQWSSYIEYRDNISDICQKDILSRGILEDFKDAP